MNVIFLHALCVVIVWRQLDLSFTITIIPNDGFRHDYVTQHQSSPTMCNNSCISSERASPLPSSLDAAEERQNILDHPRFDPASRGFPEGGAPQDGSAYPPVR